MINAVIQWSVHNRVLVLLCSILLALGGWFAVKSTPVDALPDLSDVQVIVKTRYPGQSPQVVQDQVTYPLTSALLSVPKAKTVRGFSFFGDSYVYVIFEDDTDLYWARSRVLEYLNQATANLPAQARPTLGPDATGVGWVYMYALTDTSGQHDLSDLRALQDWFLKYELQSVAGVAEVATVGGMVRQYQVEADPMKLRAYGLTMAQLQLSIQRGNQETGASVIEMAEAEYMVTATGYIDSVEAIKHIPVGVLDAGTPVTIQDVASVQLGPQMRRGLAELNGNGETVGGIIVMRYGENARQTIERVKQRIAELSPSLPEGVAITPVYDRSALIDRAVDTLWWTLAKELLVVAVICAAFLFHLRSSLVAVISLPLGILAAFIIMRVQGLNANIMSLGGIAIAIGAMTDGAIVMIENMHRHMQMTPLTRHNRWQLVSRAAIEVGPAIFFSLLIITVSFLPVFMLEAQEGRLFAPLAFTKTYAMAAAAGLSVTLVPVLMGYFIRGKIRDAGHNPLNRAIQRAYQPLLKLALSYPKWILTVALLLIVSVAYPWTKIGSEFMPPLDEGDLMYMPTTYPGISIGKARQILQQTDRLIATVPEVANVFGKVGRAETATDPAPLTMIETFIQLKPREQWRDGMTTDKLIAEFNQLVKMPGVTNAWVMPIKTRIDMLATGIKTPVGIKIAGPELAQIEAIGRQIERVLTPLPGTASVYAERVDGGRYINLDIRRDEAARHGLNIADVHAVIGSAVGGAEVTQSVEGLERYPVNLRYPQSYRNSPEQLARLPLVTPSGAHIVLGDVADISLTDGPPGIKSENGRINGWVFVDIADMDLGQYVQQAQATLASELSLPPGYALRWAGQFEYLERAQAKLKVVVPITLAVIVILLFLSFRAFTEVALILLTLPVALTGGMWLMYALGYNMSVAAGVGFIALAGVAVETGVLMLVYLNQAYQPLVSSAKVEQATLHTALLEGASKRIRPVLMTAATIIFALIPVMLSEGTGAEVMSRIAAPMVGGMVTALILTLLVLPALYLLVRRVQQRRATN